MKDNALKRKLVAIYEIAYEKRRLFRLRAYYHLRIMSPDRTISYIRKHRCSIARFGDGEFDLILGTRDLCFQHQNAEIALALRDVLCSSNDSLLLCVPRCMNTTKGCNDHAASFWVDWGRNGHHEKIVEMIRSCSGKSCLFGDALITRPYIDWKSSKRAERTYPKLCKLWDNEAIIIVEGEQTRMGVGNDLFDNAKSIKRILCPAENAFEYLKDIKQAILRNYNGELIIMALGPTATVLVADISQDGIWALDIGHIDVEYEWFLCKSKDRVAIQGKYTNEAKNDTGRIKYECTDEKYVSQIIEKIGCLG